MEKEKDPLRESYAEMNRLRIEEKKNQSAIEIQRYKQDCRKRALELAYAEYAKVVPTKEFPVESFEAISSRAEKYYQWLITIPN